MTELTDKSPNATPPESSRVRQAALSFSLSQQQGSFSRNDSRHHVVVSRTPSNSSDHREGTSNTVTPRTDDPQQQHGDSGGLRNGKGLAAKVFASAAQSLLGSRSFAANANPSNLGASTMGVSPSMRASMRFVHPERWDPSTQYRSSFSRRAGMLWQDHPRRLLRYKPAMVHRWTWIPLPYLRVFTVSVFGNAFIYFQSAILIGWCAVVHATGLGFSTDAQLSFIQVFGTAYLGSLANMGTIIALVLGLFITLVVNRWLDISSRYSTLRSTSLDLVMLARNYLVVPKPRDCHGSSSSSREAYDTAVKCADYAKRELVRYINAGHLCLLALVSTNVISTGSSPRRIVCEEDESEAISLATMPTTEGESIKGTSQSSDQPETPASFRSSTEQFEARSSSSAPLDKRCKAKHEAKVVHEEAGAVKAFVEGNGFKTHVAEVGSIRSSIAFQHGAMDAVHKEPSEEELSELGFGIGRFRVKATVREKWGKVLLHDLLFADFADDSIVTEEEWDAMAKLEDQGLPPYLTAYLWAAEIIREIGTHGWLLQQEIALPALQNKISIIRGSAESLVQLLRLQLPFIYVHLVSFTVHIYLIILATWFGFLFSVGFNRTDEAFASDENSAVSFSGDITDNDTSVKRLTGVFGYLFIIFANILFQGLLEIHAALDNPFGKEAFKIPIRLLVTDLMRATEAMIQDEATLGSVGIR
mmetsp:Transcript_4452/g.15924  ORF Transcript_4452/g.15924 Transcript_4452/m.15924 type:complete len:701 (+) Transcript_4452:462-2564(+)